MTLVPPEVLETPRQVLPIGGAAVEVHAFLIAIAGEKGLVCCFASPIKTIGSSISKSLEEQLMRSLIGGSLVLTLAVVAGGCNSKDTKATTQAAMDMSKSMDMKTCTMQSGGK